MSCSERRREQAQKTEAAIRNGGPVWTAEFFHGIVTGGLLRKRGYSPQERVRKGSRSFEGLFRSEKAGSAKTLPIRCKKRSAAFFIIRPARSRLP